MRILVVSQYFWPEDFRLNDLVEGLLGHGHEITVLTGLPNYPKGLLAPGYSWRGPYTQNHNNAKILRVPLITRGKSRGLRLGINYFSFMLFACLLAPFRCRGTYDAIFVFQASPATVGVPARLMSWMKKAPILFWIQDLWPESLSATGTVSNPAILEAVAKLVRWIYRGCTLVLIQSKAFIEPVSRMGVPLEKIEYFPNSAEALYQPVAKETEWNGPALPQGFRVMFAGNIGAAQSLGTLLAAADLLKSNVKIQWIIVGEGRQRRWLEDEIARRGLEGCVHLMGRHPVETMPLWFSQADVMLALLSRNPIFALTIPAKVQSYLACAKPIIAAIDGEASRVVTEAGAGLAVAAEDAEGLANAVLSMASLQEHELRTMGENGLRYFNSNFQREILLDKLECLLARVTENKK